ncbi:TetR/AcrR family transcriptional regulator [Arthrobacter sp. 7Tela_A1]|uniref:TetR/AcrR family transcriptional regulator n=1 Tax=Arthrobacter sp. 7Tela_A1 TaxID=3093745 RepID=UPI003BB4EAB9
MARNQEAKRRVILEATLESISRHGYEATRLRDVSESAGVSIGVIQHYFGTREQLLGEALGHASGELVEHFAALDPARLSPWRELRGMIGVVCGMPSLHGRGLLWLEMSSLVRRHPELRGRLDSVYELWDAHVRAAVQRGAADGSLGVGPESVDDLVAIFLAFFDGYEYEIASSLVPDDPAVLERRAVLLAERLFRPVGV